MSYPQESPWRRPEVPAGAGASQAPAGAQPVPAWLRELVRLMDSAFRIPGTDVRIGLDPIIGLLLPGAGDVAGALPSMLLLSLAIRQGVPPVIVLRMLLNVALDSMLGAVPLLGDLFDATYRSNEKNLALLEKHALAGRRPGAFDYLLVGFVVAVVVAIALLPLLLVALLLKLIVS
jgi:hypothetical protein